MRRLDRQAAGLEQAAAVLGGVAERLVLHQVVDGVVAEERRLGLLAPVGRPLDLEAELALLELVGLGLLDHAELGHPVEDDVAAVEGALGGVGGVVAGGVLDQAREQRGLHVVEVLGVLGEVVAGGRLDAVRAVAEVGDVEVALEDPVLGVVLLEGDRVAQLAQLAGVGVVGGGGRLLLGLRLVEQGLLDHLLGDRRATLHRAAGLVGDEGAERAADVHGAVVVVAVVLDADDRLHHLARDLAQRDVDAVLVVERGDEVAVDVVDPRLLRQLLGLQLGGEVDHALADVLGGDADDAGERDGQAGDQDAEDGGDDGHHGEVRRHRPGRRATGLTSGGGRGHGAQCTGGD